MQGLDQPFMYEITSTDSPLDQESGSPFICCCFIRLSALSIEWAASLSNPTDTEAF